MNFLREGRLNTLSEQLLALSKGHSNSTEDRQLSLGEQIAHPRALSSIGL